jgi:hypothetical protein
MPETVFACAVTSFVSFEPRSTIFRLTGAASRLRDQGVEITGF